VALALRHCPDVIVEELVSGEDLRVVVIDHEVVAAAVRKPAEIVGDGVRDVTTLIRETSRRRERATGGESRIPLDALTVAMVAKAGHTMDDVLPRGLRLRVRRTANLHTGGTIEDVTARLHPEIAAAAVRASRAIDIRSPGWTSWSPTSTAPTTRSSRPTSAPGWPTISRSRRRSGSSTCCSRRPPAAETSLRTLTGGHATQLPASRSRTASMVSASAGVLSGR
jgi:hypothetical protein